MDGLEVGGLELVWLELDMEELEEEIEEAEDGGTGRLDEGSKEWKKFLLFVWLA